MFFLPYDAVRAGRNCYSSPNISPTLVSPMAEIDRARALETALSQLDKQFGRGTVMRLGDKQASMEIAAISTGSLALDIALGIGGIPRGRITEIYGPESAGKSTLAQIGRAHV